MMIKILMTALLSLTACATTTATPIQGPDGTSNELISCLDVTACYYKATKICGGKYQIVNTSEETTPTVGLGEGAVSTTTKMLVKCLR